MKTKYNITQPVSELYEKVMKLAFIITPLLFIILLLLIMIVKK